MSKAGVAKLYEVRTIRFAVIAEAPVTYR